MTDDLSGLIERVEAGVGPDRSIDAAIYHDLLGFCRHANQERTGAQSDTGFDCMDCGADSWGNKSRKGGYPAGQGLHDSAPRYTASLDAAMTLVPDGWLIAGLWERNTSLPNWRWKAELWSPDADANVSAIAKNSDTPAIALVAASLRALQSRKDG